MDLFSITSRRDFFLEITISFISAKKLAQLTLCLLSNIILLISSSDISGQITVSGNIIPTTNNNRNNKKGGGGGGISVTMGRIGPKTLSKQQ